jgi:hypothetical protein
MPCPHHHGLVLALDQGTSSSRALLFNRDGAVVASGQCALKAHFPQPGWVEQDALEIWATQRAAIAEALARGRVDIKHVHAVGLHRFRYSSHKKLGSNRSSCPGREACSSDSQLETDESFRHATWAPCPREL